MAQGEQHPIPARFEIGKSEHFKITRNSVGRYFIDAPDRTGDLGLTFQQLLELQTFIAKVLIDEAALFRRG